MRSPQLHEAVEALYAEFRVPKPRLIDGCPCCTDPKEVCVLLAKGLRDLTPDDLSNYGSSLFLTMGAKGDFEYFLPRLFDVSTRQKWWPSPEVLLVKLKIASWGEWPSRRQAAVKRVIDVWYADQVTMLECAADDERHFIGSELDSVLCGIAQSGVAIAPYLKRLVDHPIALRFLHETNLDSLLKKKRLSNPFWRDCPQGEAEVIAFLNAPRIRELLDA
jgi:hypothetical protein